MIFSSPSSVWATVVYTPGVCDVFYALEGALFACTACMLKRSDCPCHSRLRYSLLIVQSSPFLAWAEKSKVAEGNCSCTNHRALSHL